jgi:hypothetical protein
MRDLSLVSVVLLLANQEPLGTDLRERVRQGTWRSAKVRGDCHSDSHSLVVRPSHLAVDGMAGIVNLCRYREMTILV